MRNNGRPATSAVRHVLLITTDAARLVGEQRLLITEILRRRHRVTCLVQHCAPADGAVLAALRTDVAVVPQLAATGQGMLRGLAARRTMGLRMMALAPKSALILDDVEPSGLTASLVRAGADRIVVALGDLARSVVEPDAKGPDRSARRTLRLGLRHATHILVERSHETLRLREAGVLPPLCSVRAGPIAGIDCDAEPAVAPATGRRPVCMLLWVERHCDRNEAEAVMAAAAVASSPIELVVGGLQAGPLGLARGHASLLAPHTPLATAIAAADVAVVAGAGLGMPPEIAAALSVGRAIIAPAVRGMRLAVDEGVNGMLFPPGDQAALAAAVDAVARRPDLAAMGRASRAKAERIYASRPVLADVCDALGLPPARAGSPALTRAA